MGGTCIISNGFNYKTEAILLRNILKLFDAIIDLYEHFWTKTNDIEI